MGFKFFFTAKVVLSADMHLRHERYNFIWQRWVATFSIIKLYGFFSKKTAVGLFSFHQLSTAKASYELLAPELGRTGLW